MSGMKRISTAILLLSAASSAAEWKNLTGQEAPDFAVTQWFNRSDGSSVADFRGKAILLEFWATW
jgi:hypothetical protein